jgi:hypothetical protein
LTDVMEVESIEDLNISRVSELNEIGIKVQHNNIMDFVSIDVSQGRRLASMTYPLLQHIRQNGWTIDERGNYAIDMNDWDFSNTILTLPLKHFNMSDHSRDIAALLESSVDKLQERDKVISPDATLVELFDLVNDKLRVNLAVLDVVLYGNMIVSAESNDFALPKPWTDKGLGVMKVTMANRSLSATMAYEGHQEVLKSPNSFVNINRVDHIMDSILTPHEVLEKQ